jgi:hypothetical protein
MPCALRAVLIMIDRSIDRSPAQIHKSSLDRRNTDPYTTARQTRTPRFSWRSARRWRRWSCSA